MRTLSNDALLLVAQELGVQTLPRVLAAGPQQDSRDAWMAARALALADLYTDGVLDSHGDVEAELADALFSLAHPERELVARSYTADRVTRVSVAHRAPHHAVAILLGDRYTIGTLWCDGSPEALATPLLSALGGCNPADITGFSSPTTELANRLNAAQHSGEHADALYALGLTPREATIIGSALGSCRGFAEIVAYDYSDGVTTRAPGAIAVYDTERGRLVAAPMVSPDHQIWSTVTTGSDHRLTQAIAMLLEGLPGKRWLTPQSLR